MAHRYAMIPVDERLGARPWQLVANTSTRRCRIIRDTGETHDQIEFREIPSRLALPEFGGDHKGPVFSFEGHSLEFRVDAECLRFLKMLTALCLALQGKRSLAKALWGAVLYVALGVLLIIVVAPVCFLIFLGVEERFKSHWFGFSAGAFCMGLILVVNSLRRIALLRTAMEFQKTMQVQQGHAADAEGRAADG